MTVELERAVERVEGGYRLIPVPLVCAAWTAYRQKLIEFRDLRVWFAAHEVASRRCRMRRGTVPNHTVAELQGLVGGVGGRAPASIAQPTRASPTNHVVRISHIIS
jgi:hypothetical protein